MFGTFLSLHRAQLRSYAGAVLAFALCACAPISPQRTSDQAQQANASGTPSDARVDAMRSGSGDDDEVSDKPQSARHQADEPCSEDGARACTSGNPSRQPLQCVDSVWREQPACNEGQRCESAAGPDQGSCVRIARECIGRAPDEPFCDSSNIRVCSGGVSSVARACSPQQHCVEKDFAASCECATGKVAVAGECQVPQSCTDQNGGCDALALCTMNGSSRLCGACLPGYSGDGLVGCTPLLIALDADAAMLAPELSDGVRSYRIHLPLFQAQLTLTPRAADGVQIDVNGTKLGAGESWTSEKLSVGEHPLAITLNASNGLTSRYEILVEHTGAQEAFIKAKHPDRFDTFGTSVALSGDTLVVGAVHEDGGAAGIDGDETSNSAADSGAAYVFVREGARWRQEAYLKSDAPREGGHFGITVAIEGDLLLVTEAMNDPYPYPERPESYDKRPGLVHVFTRAAGKWSAVAKIPSPSESADLFGYALAIGADQILIGAPYDSPSGRNVGAFYSMPRDGNWASATLTKYTAQGSKADDAFGWSLALAGGELLVGSPGTSNVAKGLGKALYFTRAGDSWVEQQVLTPPVSQEGNTYGWSVALSGDRIAVGAPFADDLDINPRGQAYVYARAAGKWQLQKTLTAAVPRDVDYFGYRVAFASANTLLVTASGDASAGRGLNADPTQGLLVQSGAFYLFAQEADDWVRTSFAKPDDPGTNTWLGQAAAISGDTIVVSCSNESSAATGVNGESSGSIASSGAVYVFR